MAGHAASMEEYRNAYGIWIRKPEGKRQLGRSQCEWEDNTEMDLKYDGMEGTGFIWLGIGPMTLC